MSPNLQIVKRVGHGSLFQFHEFFTRQAAAFLPSDSTFAPYSARPGVLATGSLKVRLCQ